MTWHVPLVDIDYGDAEAQAVLDVLANRWLTMGDVTMDFESQFAETVGAEYTLATSNATAALHLACLSLGIGAGDEVIVPSLSFVATASAVLYTGARVRFADILGLDELNISPPDIEKQITPHTKAIIVMHYGGYPCRMTEILDIADRHKLSVIEDAAMVINYGLDKVRFITPVPVESRLRASVTLKDVQPIEGGAQITNAVTIELEGSDRPAAYIEAVIRVFD